MNIRFAVMPALVYALGALSPSASAQGLLEDYKRADALLNVSGKLHNLSVNPQWIGKTDRFWYRRTSAQGSEFVLVDSARNTSKPAFDHAKLAKSLSHLTGKSYAATRLPFYSFEERGNFDRLRISLEGKLVECELRNHACTEIKAPQLLLPGEIASPDGRWAAFSRDHDLYLRSLRDGREVRLTSDGVENYGYGEWADSHLLSISAQLAGEIRPVRVLWSPDSKKLVSYQVDQRRIPATPFVQWVPPEGYGARPKVHWARVPMPADAHSATARLVLFHVQGDDTVRQVDVALDPVPLFYDLIGTGASWSGQMWWDAASRNFHHVWESRGYREARLYETDADSGRSRIVLEEHAPTGLLNSYMQLADGLTESRVHWISARDGWKHLYRHELASGRLLSQVTRGEWRVDGLKHADDGEGWIYFTAGGREPGVDPYYLQLYRARPDGSRLERLTPDDNHHEVSISPTGRFFVARGSRVDLAPTTVLRRADGSLVRTLEKADISALVAQGRQTIERFHAKGRDGITDIYATVFRPSNFDPGRKYPVLDDIYGGPQAIHAERSFSIGSALAELGFINVQIDGMGTPGRSQAFQEVSYGKGFAEAGGLEDHIAVLKALGAKYPWVDLDRVGIYGYSGGGYGSARAMIDYPHFFKVAVSSAGSHDQSLYQLEWGERFIGRPQWDPAAYELQANSRHVDKFNGKLLLAHGDLDDDVPIVNTMQLVDALIKANKDVDLLIVPGTNHSTMGGHPYFIRRQWDYFVRNLMGVEPPSGFQVGLQ